MAGIALILRYQWRAFWRRFIRTRQRAHFYFTALAVLLWAFFAILPATLTRAATELAAGQTTSMDAVLWSFCALWLVVLVWLVGRGTGWLSRRGVRRRLDRITGVVLIGFGIRVAADVR